MKKKKKKKEKEKEKEKRTPVTSRAPPAASVPFAWLLEKVESVMVRLESWQWMAPPAEMAILLLKLPVMLTTELEAIQTALPESAILE